MANKEDYDTMSLKHIMDKHTSAVPPQLKGMLSSPMQPPPDVDSKTDDNANSWKKMKNIRVIARFRPANKVEKKEAKKKKIQDLPPKIEHTNKKRCWWFKTHKCIYIGSCISIRNRTKRCI